MGDRVEGLTLMQMEDISGSPLSTDAVTPSRKPTHQVGQAGFALGWAEAMLVLPYQLPAFHVPTQQHLHEEQVSITEEKPSLLEEDFESDSQSQAPGSTHKCDAVTLLSEFCA